MKPFWKVSLALLAVVVLSLGLMAFGPLGGDSDNDGVSDHTEALANALDISVEDLQAAQQTAKEAAIAQALEEGSITQDQADALLAGEISGKGCRHFGGSDYNAFLADALGISTDELQAAEQTVRESLGLADKGERGTFSENGELADARSNLLPYLEGAYQQAYQAAVDTALSDGAITDDEAAQLLENIPSIGHGFGSRGGRP